jgi:Fic family protein
MTKSQYTPPYTITTEIIKLISQISEILGQLAITESDKFIPQLRRKNRLLTIHASLAIENNTLSLEQVTNIINGRKVLGKPQEIKEVKNAFTAYEKLEQLDPLKQKDLLLAHKLLMEKLVEKLGKYRCTSVGIAKGENIIHIAPPARNVPSLINDLFGWLNKTDVHPLIASSVFHYEIEFIHPFTDGNGRVGRLWQTLILSKWRPLLAYLPVETIIHNNHDDYYHVLSQADKQAESTPFIVFMLNSIILALKEFNNTDPVSDPVSDPVKSLLVTIKTGALSAGDIRDRLNLKHRQSFRKNYLHPALEQKLIEQTIPEKPTSRLQKYRLTPHGKALLAKLENIDCH